MGGGKRNSSIELLRLLSMLMIVSFHLCVGNRYDWFLAQPPTPTKVAYQFLMGGGWVGNFIFFTISIWFLLDRQNTLKSSLKRIWILERELLFWSLALFAATLFLRKAGLYSVVPEFLRTLVFARPRGDDQFADCTFSPSLDMSR